MKKVYWLISITLFLFLFYFKIDSLAQHHSCNQSCTGAANITCNEQTDAFNYNRGSCNTGLACYSGAGNRCRNPYCPNDSDCNCSTFTIQGYKQPNSNPFANQSITLDGANPQTTNPYFFTNVPANTIHRVNVSAPLGSSVGYTLCYDSTNCHTNTPTPGNQVYICSNKSPNTNLSYADLWWHYTPQTPNCYNLRINNQPGPVTVLLGDQISLSAYFTSTPNGPLTKIGLVVAPTNCGTPWLFDYSSDQTANGNYNTAWTANQIGTFNVFCRAWNDAIAECRGRCVDGPPRYQCDGTDGSGAGSYTTITVVGPTPTPCSSPPIPENSSPANNSVIKVTQFPRIVFHRALSVSASCGSSSLEYQMGYDFTPADGGDSISGLCDWSSNARCGYDYNNSGTNNWRFKSRIYDAYYHTYRISNWGTPWRVTVCVDNGASCSLNSDCCSGYCDLNYCAQPVPTPPPTDTPTPIPTLAPTDTPTPTPTPPSCVPDGSLCSLNTDCCSGYCDLNYCAPIPTSTPIPTPTLYPTVAIYGALKEYLGSSCTHQGINSSGLSIRIIPQSSSGITSSCGVTPAAPPYSLYRCTLTFNNQTANPTPAQNAYLSVSTSGYSSAYWTDDNLCSDQANNSLSFNVASSPPNNVFEKDIFFQVYPWIKLKDASFNKYQGSLVNPIPNSVLPYDSDDTGEPYFIIGSAGLVAANQINLNNAPTSSNNWRVENYTPQKVLNPSLFVSYASSRKESQTISDINLLSETKINLFQGNLTINETNKTQFSDKKIVLIVNGTVNIEVNGSLFTSSSNVAIIADTINFAPTVTEAKGIFIANTINTGNTNNQGLKIDGNLIALSNLNNGRRWQDGRKPSVFVILNPSIYLNLLDKLSIDKYDWQQIQ